MKKIYLFFAATAFLFIGFQPVHGQNVLGPYDKYVSVQQGNDLTIANGSYPASADEGRSIDVEIINITGPIIVSPSSYKLMGPPCPSYDAHGKRSPSVPAMPNTTVFNGKVSVDPAKIPAPGTMVPAQFTGKDLGYYTHCAKNQKVAMDSQRTVKFNINSINLVIGNKDIGLCKGENCYVSLGNIFPKNKGTVSWISVKGNFTVSGDNNGATLKGVTNGDDLLVATFTVDKATFKDTAKVSVGTVAFAKAENVTPHYKGGSLDCNTLLDKNSVKKDLRWRIVTRGLTGTIDSLTGILTFPANPGGTYVIEVKIKGSKTCVATTKVIMMGFSVVLKTNKTYCDGAEAPVKIVPVPATLKPAELAAFGKIELYSECKNKFVGNPINKEKLEFDALDASYNSKVKNCYWYSSDLKGFCNFAGCNGISTHMLKAKAKVNGNDAFSYSDPELKISILAPCIEGFTSAVQTFTGAPKFKLGAINVRGGQIPVILVDDEGTLKRDPKGKVTTLKCNDNSQFKKYIDDEENYHVGQIEGKNGTICADLWLVANVMANLRALQKQGFPNLVVANQAALTAITLENTRCNNLMVYPQPKRCALEKEAKTATGIKFGYNYKCAYCQCADNK
jgi:hypothetical protein